MQKISLFFVAMLCLGNVFSQNHGESGFSSSAFHSSARIQALGGSVGAMQIPNLVDGADVASLLKTNGPEFTLSGASIFKGLGSYEMVYGQQLPIQSQEIYVGTALNYFNFGTFTQTNEYGQDLGDFRLYDFSFKVFGSWWITDAYSLGAQIKYDRANLFSSSANRLQVSVNGTYRLEEKGLLFTADLRNHGFVFGNTTGANYKNSPDWRLYASKKLKNAPFTFHATWVNLRKWDIIYRDPNASPRVDPITGDIIPVKEPSFMDKTLAHLIFGSELSFSKNLAIYVGYNYRLRQELMVSSKPGTVGVAWGFKVGLKGLTLEYARNKVHLANTINAISISLPLNGILSSN